MSRRRSLCAIVLLVAGGVLLLTPRGWAASVSYDFSGYHVIEAFEGTEGSATGTLAGTVGVGDPVWGSLTYDSGTGALTALSININNVILYSGPPASAYTSVAVTDDPGLDVFRAVTTHGNPTANLTLPSGVTDNLVYLQAGLSLFDSSGTLYSGTTLPTSLDFADFTWSRVHLWVWFPDLDGDGVSNTAWRIFADRRTEPIPEPGSLALTGLGACAAWLMLRHRRRRPA